MGDLKHKTESYWRERLTPEQFAVCRQKATEQPFSGRLNNETAAGTYHCVCCGAVLFSSTAKFDSGCGWPSFDQPIRKSSIEEVPDHSHGMIRTEIVCSNCGSHLGHVFPDGPTATGLRYCVNSLSLDLTKADKQ